jgi:hypothetical protein
VTALRPWAESVLTDPDPGAAVQGLKVQFGAMPSSLPVTPSRSSLATMSCVDTDEIRHHIVELSEKFGIEPPGAVQGKTPQGVECMAKAGGRQIVIGPAFKDLPEDVQYASFALLIAAFERRGSSGKALMIMVFHFLVILAMGVGIGLAFSFVEDPPPLALEICLLACLAAYVILRSRRFIYACDRKVADVCGKETVFAILDHERTQSSRPRGIYWLLTKLQPSSDRRAARLSSKLRANL